MLDAGLIDQTVGARAILKAEKDSGLGEVRRAGAAEAGTQEARSAILKAQDQARAGSDPLQAIAQGTVDQKAAMVQLNANIDRMHAMMRQFLGATTPVMGRL
jgi:hypothetical protein